MLSISAPSLSVDYGPDIGDTVKLSSLRQEIADKFMLSFEDLFFTMNGIRLPDQTIKQVTEAHNEQHLQLILHVEENATIFARIPFMTKQEQYVEIAENKALLVEDDKLKKEFGNPFALSFGRTYSHVAAKYSPLLLNLLIEQGLIHRDNADSKDEMGNTPLLFATRSGQTDAISQLIALGSDPHNINKAGKTLFHFFVEGNENNEEMCEQMDVFLSKYHITMYSRCKSGNTPVHDAVIHGNENAVKYFVKTKNFHLMTPNEDGNTCLHLAVLEKNEKMITLLLELGSLEYVANKEHQFPQDLAHSPQEEVPNQDFETQNAISQGIYNAVLKNNLECLLKLLEKSRMLQAAAFYQVLRLGGLWAAARGYMQILKSILDYSVETGDADAFIERFEEHDGTSLLYILCQTPWCQKPWCQEPSGTDLELYMDLLDQCKYFGSGINGRSKSKNDTCLHIAALARNKVAIDFLLRKRAPAACFNTISLSPLHYAIIHNCSSRILDTLVSHKSLDINSQSIEKGDNNVSSIAEFANHYGSNYSFDRVIVSIKVDSFQFNSKVVSFVFKHSIGSLNKQRFISDESKPSGAVFECVIPQRDSNPSNGVAICIYENEEKCGENNWMAKGSLVLDQSEGSGSGSRSVPMFNQENQKEGNITLSISFKTCDLPEFYVVQGTYSERENTFSKDSPGNSMRNRGYVPKYPMVIVPGFADCSLEVWQSPNLDRVRTQVWMDEGNWANERENWLRHVRLADDGISDPEGYVVRPGEGIASLENIRSGKENSSAFCQLFKELARAGYTPQNLAAAPYDWRLPPSKLEERDGFFTKLKNQIEFLKESNRESVVLVGHSMGNNIIQYFLEWIVGQDDFGRKWIRKNVHGFCALGAPFLGMPKSLRSCASGPFLESEKGKKVFGITIAREAKELASNSASLPMLFPKNICDHQIYVRKNDSYEVESILQLLEYANSPCKEFYEMYYEKDLLLENQLQPPPVNNLWVLYGTNLPTEVSYYFRRDNKELLALDSSADKHSGIPGEMNHAGLLIEGGIGKEIESTFQQSIQAKRSGDGTVPYCSLSYPRKWREMASAGVLPFLSSVDIEEFEGIGHRSMLSEPQVIYKILNTVCVPKKRLIHISPVEFTRGLFLSSPTESSSYNQKDFTLEIVNPSKVASRWEDLEKEATIPRKLKYFAFVSTRQEEYGCTFIKDLLKFLRTHASNLESVTLHFPGALEQSSLPILKGWEKFSSLDFLHLSDPRNKIKKKHVEKLSAFLVAHSKGKSDSDGTCKRCKHISHLALSQFSSEKLLHNVLTQAMYKKAGDLYSHLYVFYKDGEISATANGKASEIINSFPLYRPGGKRYSLKKPSDYEYACLTNLVYNLLSKDSPLLKNEEEPLLPPEKVPTKHGANFDPTTDFFWGVMCGWRCVEYVQEGFLEGLEYRGAVFVNKYLRHVILVTMGTKTIGSGLTDFEGVCLNWETAQERAGERLLKKVLNCCNDIYGMQNISLIPKCNQDYSIINEEANRNSFQLSFCGHSLGAWLSEILVTKASLLGLRTSSVTFDCPGSLPRVSSILRDTLVENWNIQQTRTQKTLSKMNAFNSYSSPQQWLLDGVFYQCNNLVVSKTVPENDFILLPKEVIEEISSTSPSLSSSAPLVFKIANQKKKTLIEVEFHKVKFTALQGEIGISQKLADELASLFGDQIGVLCMEKNETNHGNPKLLFSGPDVQEQVIESVVKKFDCVRFVSTPNLVNSLHQQLGTVQCILRSTDQARDILSIIPSYLEWLDPTTFLKLHAMDNFLCSGCRTGRIWAAEVIGNWPVLWFASVLPKQIVRACFDHIKYIKHSPLRKLMESENFTKETYETISNTIKTLCLSSKSMRLSFPDYFSFSISRLLPAAQTIATLLSQSRYHPAFREILEVHTKSKFSNFEFSLDTKQKRLHFKQLKHNKEFKSPLYIINSLNSFSFSTAAKKLIAEYNSDSGEWYKQTVKEQFSSFTTFLNSLLSDKNKLRTFHTNYLQTIIALPEGDTNPKDIVPSEVESGSENKKCIEEKQRKYTKELTEKFAKVVESAKSHLPKDHPEFAVIALGSWGKDCPLPKKEHKVLIVTSPCKQSQKDFAAFCDEVVSKCEAEDIKLTISAGKPGILGVGDIYEVFYAFVHAPREGNDGKTQKMLMQVCTLWDSNCIYESKPSYQDSSLLTIGAKFKSLLYAIMENRDPNSSRSRSQQFMQSFSHLRKPYEIIARESMDQSPISQATIDIQKLSRELSRIITFLSLYQRIPSTNPWQRIRALVEERTVSGQLGDRIALSWNVVQNIFMRCATSTSRDQKKWYIVENPQISNKAGTALSPLEWKILQNIRHYFLPFFLNSFSEYSTWLESCSNKPSPFHKNKETYGNSGVIVEYYFEEIKLFFTKNSNHFLESAAAHELCQKALMHFPPEYKKVSSPNKVLIEQKEELACYEEFRIIIEYVESWVEREQEITKVITSMLVHCLGHSSDKIQSGLDKEEVFNNPKSLFIRLLALKLKHKNNPVDKIDLCKMEQLLEQWKASEKKKCPQDFQDFFSKPLCSESLYNSCFYSILCVMVFDAFSKSSLSSCVVDAYLHPHCSPLMQNCFDFCFPVLQQISNVLPSQRLPITPSGTHFSFPSQGKRIEGSLLIDPSLSTEEAAIMTLLHANSCTSPQTNSQVEFVTIPSWSALKNRYFTEEISLQLAKGLQADNCASTLQISFGNQIMIVSFFPSEPGLQIASNLLSKRISGGAIPSVLIGVKQNHKEEVFHHILLRNIQPRPKQEKPRLTRTSKIKNFKVDSFLPPPPAPFLFTMKVFESLIFYPSNDGPEQMNIAESTNKNEFSDFSSLAPSGLLCDSGDTPMLRSFLFCHEYAKSACNEEAVKVFLFLSPKEVLEAWLKDITRHNDPSLLVPMFPSPYTVSAMYQRFAKLQTLLRKKKEFLWNMTHLNLLKIEAPPIFPYYNNMEGKWPFSLDKNPSTVSSSHTAAQDDGKCLKELYTVYTIHKEAIYLANRKKTDKEEVNRHLAIFLSLHNTSNTFQSLFQLGQSCLMESKRPARKEEEFLNSLSKISHIQALDLSFLHRFDEVKLIDMAKTNGQTLRSLNLSGMRLPSWASLAQILTECNHLQILHLNKIRTDCSCTKFSWGEKGRFLPDLFSIIQKFPPLPELFDLKMNNCKITSLQMHLNEVPSLQNISVAGNKNLECLEVIAYGVTVGRKLDIQFEDCSASNLWNIANALKLEHVVSVNGTNVEACAPNFNPLCGQPIVCNIIVEEAMAKALREANFSLVGFIAPIAIHSWRTIRSTWNWDTTTNNQTKGYYGVWKVVTEDVPNHLVRPETQTRKTRELYCTLLLACWNYIPDDVSVKKLKKFQNLLKAWTLDGDNKVQLPSKSMLGHATDKFSWFRK